MDLLVSVYIVTYGQEAYISQAIDSVLMQKTSFEFEILIAEDASPDGTRDILKNYELKYPQRFQMLYLDKNTFYTENNAFSRLRKMCKGKYIICLEGDDYWTDELKLQTQVDYLEKHPECIAVAHNCSVVDENSEKTDEVYPECTDKIYTIYHWLAGVYPGQTTTLMMKNPKYLKNADWSIIEKGIMPGDILLNYALILNGQVHCIQRKMSAYRHITKSGTSYSANYIYEYSKMERLFGEILHYAYNNGNKVQIKCAEYSYYRSMVQGMRRGVVPPQKLISIIKCKTNIVALAVLYIKQLFNRKILHKRLYFS